MSGLDREALAVALLLSLPMGAGVALATLETAGRAAGTVAVLAGAVTAVAVFALVAVAARSGSADPDGGLDR